MKYSECENNNKCEKFEYICQHSQYKIGDVVAIQQAYKECFGEVDATNNKIRKTIGWSNKMFVAASLMPHHIRITGVCVERLQLIPYDDCLREGINEMVESQYIPAVYYYGDGSDGFFFDTPRAAFAALIDKVCGRGIWESNPLVWVYSFELVD